MPCFRINLEAFGESYSEQQLLKWANRFFVATTWSKPVLHAQTANGAELDVKELQQRLSTNLRRWGAKSSQRYCRQWIVTITRGEFMLSSPAKTMITKHRLERLAAILSPEGAGLRALKENAAVGLAKRALEKSEAEAKAFYDEYDKTIADPRIYNDPEAMAPLKSRERELCDRLLVLQKRYEAAVERDAKRQRVS